MHPLFGQVCEGKCVPMETSCDLVDSENDSESGVPDEYSNGDGEFFDIRLVVNMLYDKSFNEY